MQVAHQWRWLHHAGMPKRKAGEAGLPATIRQEPASTSGSGPFVVYFPSAFEPNGSIPCEWQTYAHSERKNQYVVVAKTERQLDFVGSTSSAEYSSVLPCRYALGLFSRGAARLEVMPAEGGKVLRMEPRVHGESYEPRGTTTVIEAGKMKEANMRLVEEFGSQRRKRQLKAKEAGKVEAHHVSAGQAVLGMIASAGAAAAQTKDEIIKSALAHRNIPPHHPEATTASEAYRFEELVPPSIRDALEITKLFPAENKPEYREQLRSSGMFGAGYVLSRLSLLSTSDSALREERCRLLAMLGHLLKLHNRFSLRAGSGGLAELADKVKTAPSVLEGLLELFYVGEDAGAGGDEEATKYMLSKEKRNLMVNYILVLAVRAEAGNMLEPQQFQALADELKQRPMELVRLYRELGCTEIAVNSTNPEDGTRTKSFRISLMPGSVEEKTLADYFPALKLGARKR